MHIYALTRYMYKGYKYTHRYTQKNSNNEMAHGYISLLDADPEGQRFMTLVFTITFGFKSHHNTHKKAPQHKDVCMHVAQQAERLYVSSYQHITMINAHDVLSCT